MLYIVLWKEINRDSEQSHQWQQLYVSMLAWIVVDRECLPWLGQSKDYIVVDRECLPWLGQSKNYIIDDCCFSSNTRHYGEKEKTG